MAGWIQSLADFAPDGIESGVGLALQDDTGRYVFFLAGRRHRCLPGELFYAGIGGHREPGESWMECAQREAREEIGTEVEILPSPMSYYVPHHAPIESVEIVHTPQPFALYEMVHQPDAPRAGEIYRIVIYQARLDRPPRNLPPDEVQGVIALTAAQVRQGIHRKPTLATLQAEGAIILAGAEMVAPSTQLYPIGTAKALAIIMGADL